MDCPKIEQSAGIKSRIPVRTIRPPSKPSFTKSAQENQSYIKKAQPQCKTVKNVSAKTLKNASETLQAPDPGKKFLPSHHTRFNSQPQSKAVGKVVQTKTKSSAILDKPTKKPFTFENRKITNVASNGQNFNLAIAKNNIVDRRLTSAASNIQNVNLALAKNNIVDRRLIDISRKNLNQKCVNLLEKNDNQKFNSKNKSPIKKNTNIGALVRKQGFQPDKFKKLIGQKTYEELVPKIVVSKLSISSVEDEVNEEIDSSSMSDGFSNLQVADEKGNGEFGFLQHVEFVPDEKSRNQILFGQGISPTLKPAKFKSSVVDRPSFFLKSKTAQRHIENLEEAKRASMLQMTGLKVRPSQPSKCDPIQAVLRALENVDLVAEDRRVSTMKKNNPSYGSPKRLSPYKQQVDPYKTALKRIEALQMKKKAKSTKKVTFNLDSSVPNDNMKCDNMNGIEKNEKPNCRKALTFSKEDVKDEETKSPCPISPPKPNETTPELQLPANSSYLANNLKRNLTQPHLTVSNEEVEYEVFKEKKDPYPISPPKPKETTPELQVPANSSYTADKPERNLTQSHYYNMLLRVCDRICSPDKQKHLNSDKLGEESKSSRQVNIKTSGLAGSNPNSSKEPAAEGIRSSLYLQQSQLIENRRVSALRLNNPFNKKHLATTSSITSQGSSTPELKPSLRISESVGPCFRTLSSRLAQPVREDNRYSLYLPRWQQNSALEDTRYSLYLPSRPQPFPEDQSTRRNTLSKLITPKPISFFPKPGDQLSISPEFLCRRTSTIVAPAPISTPMVLRTMAANLEDSLSPLGFGSPSGIEDSGKVCQRLNLEDSLSPSGFGSPSGIYDGGEVCQRLNFDEETEDRTVEEKRRVMAVSPRKFCKFSFKGVLTNQQILDNLADEECMAISSFTWFPGTTDRNFWNPVAQILTHGDDMHFVPVKLK